MKEQTFTLDGADGRPFLCYAWLHENPTAVVQVVHGAAEHAGRYAPFAQELSNNGFAVFAQDNRGHGRNTGDANPPGIMGPANALERNASDVLILSSHARSLYPGIPLVLFGHSMGTLISQLALMEGGANYSAVVLSGLMSVDILAQAAPLIDGAVRQEGRDRPAETLQAGMFAALMEGFPNPRTPFDWLSRDAEQVDLYINDPLCGFALSNGAWQDAAAAAPRTADLDQLRRIPGQLPILLLSGSDDPVHLGGSAMHQLIERYRHAGITRVDQKIYSGGRHEMLNETNREEVMRDAISWIRKALESAAAAG